MATPGTIRATLMLLVLALGAATSVHAQSEAANADDTRQSDAPETVDTIPVGDQDNVVLPPVEVRGQRDDGQPAFDVREASTATGTDTPILETPVSVQVISRAVIKAMGARRLDEIARNVSGVAPSEGSTLISARETTQIRGFSQNTIYYDGFRLAATPGVDVSSVERLEVLKGPASILYGLVEPGGILNIVPRQPDTADRVNVGLDAREFDSRNVSLDSTGGYFGGRVGTTVVASLSSRQSFRDTIFADRAFGLAGATVEFGDGATRMSVSTSAQRDRNPFDEGYAYTLDGEPAAPRTTYLGEPDAQGSRFSSSLSTAKLSHALSPAVTLRTGVLYQDYDHRFEAYRPFGDPGEEPVPIPTLQLLAAADAIPGLGGLIADVGDPVAPDEISRFYDRSGIGFDTLQGKAEAVVRADWLGFAHTVLAGFDVREEISDVREFRGLDIVGGGELFPQKINIVDPQYGDTPPTQVTADGFFDRRQVQTGVYVQNQMATTNRRLHLLYGARFDRVEQTQTSLRAVEQFAALLNPTAPAPEPETSQRTDEALTGRVGVLYTLTDWMAPYASVSTSFIPLSLDVAAAEGEELEPETGIQFEIGTKFNALDDRLIATVAAYRIDKQDVAVRDPNGPPGTVTNGGELRSQGVEIDVTAEPLPGLQGVVGLAWTDTRPIRSDVIPPGASFRNVPEYSGGLTISYAHPRGRLAGLGGTVSAYAASERAGSVDNGFFLDGYAVVDVALSWTPRVADVPLGLRLGVFNVFDTGYDKAANALSSVVPGEPRTIGLRLEMGQ